MIDNQKRIINSFKSDYNKNFLDLFGATTGIGISIPLVILIWNLSPADNNVPAGLFKIILTLLLACAIICEFSMVLGSAKNLIFIKLLMDKVRNYDYTVHEVHLSDNPKHIKNGVCYLTVINNGEELELSCTEEIFNASTKDTLVYRCEILVKTKKDKTITYNVFIPQVDMEVE